MLEGRFEIGILPDGAPGKPHPFRIGNTRLRPHDGTGYIKASLAEKMGWYAKAQAQKIEPYGGYRPSANLPVQALQHYRRDEMVATELVDTLAQRLKSGEALSNEDLFRSATSALMCGYIAVAVPTDGQLALCGRTPGGVHPRPPSPKASFSEQFLPWRTSRWSCA